MNETMNIRNAKSDHLYPSHARTVWSFRPSELLESQLEQIMEERRSRGEIISKQKLLEELVLSAVEMKMGGLRLRP